MNLIKKITSIVFSDTPILSKTWARKFMLSVQFIFGLLWLEGASWKVIIDGQLGLNYDGLRYWVSKGSDYPVLGAYKWLIDQVILPNIKIFLVIVFLTELTIGLLLVLGKHIRLAVVLAAAQTLAITLSLLHAPNEWKWSYIMMFVISAILFVYPTTSKWPEKLLRKK